MNVSEGNVSAGKLIQTFSSRQSEDKPLNSQLTQNVTSVESSSDTLKTPAGFFMGNREGLQQNGGLLQKLTSLPPPIEKKSSGVVDILMGKYKEYLIQSKESKPLSLTCVNFKNYLVNPEGENIRRGVSTHNTAAALAACEELNEYSIGLSYVKLFGVTGNPEGRRSQLLVNGKNIKALYQISESGPTCRTLTMMMDAGILYKSEIVRKFQTTDECKIKNIIIEEKINSLSVRERNEKPGVEVEDSVNEVFSTLKSDSFIKEWIRSGYSTEKEHENCISILGDYINFTYSDLSGRSLSIHFREYDLTGSSFDNCQLYKCFFNDAFISGVTMYNTAIENCNGHRDQDDYTARQLIEEGVEGIDLSDFEET